MSAVSKICESLFATEWFGVVLKCYREVYQELGHGHCEKKYQKAFSKALNDQKIKHEREVEVPMFYKGECIGKGMLDFLVNDEVIIEMKTLASDPRTEDIRQLQNYLIHSPCKIGFCINFPKNYQESLTVVVIISSQCIYFFKGEVVTPPHPEEWYIFNMKMEAVPLPRHKLKSLGLLTISSST